MSTRNSPTQFADLKKEVGMLAAFYFPVVIVQYWISVNLVISETGYTSMGPGFDLLISSLPNIVFATWLAVVTWRKTLNSLAFGILGLGLGVHAALIYLICICVQAFSRREDATGTIVE